MVSGRIIKLIIYDYSIINRMLIMNAKNGKLYVVATPIGNLEDITIRALRILREVHFIAAEDTRHTKQLLHHFKINKKFFSLHEHNEQERINQVISLLEHGRDIALVSDAGTPLISDPGFLLVRALRRKLIPVIPIPGASSVTVALSVSGLPTNRFVFEGFLSHKPTARRARLRLLSREDRTLVFFESRHQIRETLIDLALEMGGDRMAVVARELTKRFEEIHGATLNNLLVWLDTDPNRIKGEFVILVQGALVNTENDIVHSRHLLAALLKELPISRTVIVAGEITGLHKNLLYNLALDIRNRQLDEMTDAEPLF
jgi:16S rRNA (cytidine1402-2'-O)-methyltransferase